MSDVSSIQLPDGVIYDIADTLGREGIEKINKWIADSTSVVPEKAIGLQVDYQNRTFTRLGLAATMIDSDTGRTITFSDFPMYGGRKRCIVADDGTILANWGETGYVETGYLTQAIDNYPIGTPVQVMVYQPKFYYRVDPVRKEAISDGCGYHLRCANYWISDEPLPGFKLHPAFINEDGEVVDYYLTGAYEACIYDTSESEYITDDSQIADFATDKLSSIAGVKPCSGKTQNLTRANCEALGKNRGNCGWHNTTIWLESAEQLLMMIELGTMNMQTAIGSGVTSISDSPNTTNNSSYTGSTSSLGNLTGHATSTINERDGTEYTYTANGYVSVSYRGRENPYGNIWQFVQGMQLYGDGNQKGGIPFICRDFTFGENETITAGETNYDMTMNNYGNAGFTATNASNYINAMGYGDPTYDWLFVASECASPANSSLPVGDYTYVSSNLNGRRVAQLGGHWINTAFAGSFYWYLNTAVSYRNRAIGGRAALIPRRNVQIAASE